MRHDAFAPAVLVDKNLIRLRVRRVMEDTEGLEPLDDGTNQIRRQRSSEQSVVLCECRGVCL